MGSKIRGFMQHKRAEVQYQAVADRVQHYKEFETTLADDLAQIGMVLLIE